MSDEQIEYKKSFEDELDWNLIEQLHRVVLQISGFCFRTKQICLTVDIAVMGLLIKFSGNNLNKSVFVAGLLVPFAFWFLDSVAYYYQVKVRGTMLEIRNQLRNRNARELIQTQNNNTAPTGTIISSERSDRPLSRKIIDSVFNHSMWLYVFLIIADLILWALFSLGNIG